MSKFFEMNESKFESTETKQNNSFAKINYFKPNVGDNQIRICPPYSEDGLNFQLVKAHPMLSLQNDETGQIQTVNPVCLDFLFANEERCRNLLKIAINKEIIKKEDLQLHKDNSGCPICKIAIDAWKKVEGYKAKGDKENAKNFSEIAKRASTQEKFFFNIIDRKDGELKVFNCSGHIFEDIKKEHKLVKEERINIFDHKNGRDAILTKKQTGARISYEIDFVRKSSPLGFEGELINLDMIAVFGIKDYITMLDVINSTNSLRDYVKQFKITFAE